MQNKILIGLVLTLVILVFIPVYWATESGRQETAQKQMMAESVERGAGLYASSCTSCHGAGGEGGIGPALKDGRLDEPALKKIITRGATGTAMPAFGEEEDGPFNKHQITDMANFIINWEETLPVTEPEPITSPARLDDGEALYTKSCAACHGPQAEGTAIGPRIAGLSTSVVRIKVRNAEGAMPPFSVSQISDTELDSITAFIAALEEARAPALE